MMRFVVRTWKAGAAFQAALEDLSRSDRINPKRRGTRRPLRGGLTRTLRLVAASLAVIAPQAIAETGERCAAPANYCGQEIELGCLSAYGAGTVKAGVNCDEQLARYRACLTETAELCVGEASMAPAPRGPDGGVRPVSERLCTSETERELWEEVKGEDDCFSYAAFIEACPGGPRTKLAKGRMTRLGCGDAAASRNSAPEAAETAPLAVPGARPLTSKPGAMSRLSADQRALLDGYDAVRASALRQVRDFPGLTPADAVSVVQALRHRTVPIRDSRFAGAWRCERRSLIFLDPLDLDAVTSIEERGLVFDDLGGANGADPDFMVVSQGPILTLEGALSLYQSDRMLFGGGFVGGISGLRGNDRAGWVYALADGRIRMEVLARIRAGAVRKSLYEIWLCAR